MCVSNIRVPEGLASSSKSTRWHQGLLRPILSQDPNELKGVTDRCLEDREPEPSSGHPICPRLAPQPREVIQK